MDNKQVVYENIEEYAKESDISDPANWRDNRIHLPEVEGFWNPIGYDPIVRKYEGETEWEYGKGTEPTYSYAINPELRQHIQALQDDGTDPNLFLPDFLRQERDMFMEGDAYDMRDYRDYTMTYDPESQSLDITRNPTLLAYNDGEGIRVGLAVSNLIDHEYEFNEPLPDLRELFYFAKSEMAKFGHNGQIHLHYVNDTGDNRVRNITISAEDVDSYEEFEARKEMIEAGELKGSDRWAGGDITWTLSTNKMRLRYKTIQADGKCDMIYKTDGIVGVACKLDKYRGNCGFQVLKTIAEKLNNKDILDMIARNPDKVELECINYEKLRQYLIGVNVEWIHNSVGITLNNRQRQYLKKLKVSIAGDRVRKVFNIRKGQWSKRIIETPASTPDCYIYFDNKEGHFDLGFTEPEIRDDVYLSNSSDFYIKNGEEYKLFATSKTNEQKGNKIQPTEIRYCFFDYETIVKWSEQSCMKPYSLSWLILNDKELSELENADFNEKEEILDKYKKKAVCVVGWDCSYQFVEYILNNQNNIMYKFISFNGVAFDNYLLIEHLLTKASEHSIEYDVGGIFYNGSQLLNFKINMTHSCFDIAKHLVGSLDANCRDWNVKGVAKQTFNHHKTQLLYENDKRAFIKNIHSTELIEYNKHDVLSLAVIFRRYKTTLENMEITKEYGEKLHDSLTIGGIVWRVFRNWNRGKVNFPKFVGETAHFYNELHRCKIAGRVEMMNGAGEIFEKIASMDVCSLYPYIMSILDVYFPCGEIVEFKDISEVPEGLIYYQYVWIDQSHLKDLNLPQIYALKKDGMNNWDEPIIDKYIISNVMIDLLDEYDCITKRTNGFYFTEKRKNYEIFGFLNYFMTIKNQQDEYKRAKDPRYNPCLRETAKLISNAISGKVIEGLHTNKIEEGDMIKYLKIKSDAETKRINCINTIGDRIFFDYDITDESILEQQRPIYLGCLVYDYSRRYMYQHAYSKTIGGNIHNVYTDTDCLKCRDRHINYEYMENQLVPHWKELEKDFPIYKTHKLYQKGSKVYGSFENELTENDYFACFQKKSWVCCNNEKVLEDKGQTKASFKGVSPKSVLLLGLPEEDMLYDEEGKLDQQQTNRFYNESKMKIYNKEEGIDNYYLLSQTLMSNMKKGLRTRILCMSFRKVVKNSRQGVGVEDKDKHKRNNYIKMVFCIKNIKLTDYKTT